MGLVHHKHCITNMYNRKGTAHMKASDLIFYTISVFPFISFIFQKNIELTKGMYLNVLQLFEAVITSPVVRIDVLFCHCKVHQLYTVPQNLKLHPMR